MPKSLTWKGTTYTQTDNFEEVIPSIKKKKNNINSLILNSYLKPLDVSLASKKSKWNLVSWFFFTLTGFGYGDLAKREVSLFVFQDMINLYKIWRQIRGYPTRGQRTWSNGNSAKNNSKLLHDFRVKQFFTAFGGKKRISFTTLLLAEYTNKLWMQCFTSEWLQARKSLKKFLHRKTKHLQVDVLSLSKSLTSGYKRRGNAAKSTKANKQFKSATIGLPLFFCKYMYQNVLTRRFPYKLSIQQEERKHTGSPKKKGSKKKKILKKKAKKK